MKPVIHSLRIVSSDSRRFVLEHQQKIMVKNDYKKIIRLRIAGSSILNWTLL
jgi:hypothetical protein